MEWASLHQNELMENWVLLKEERSVKKNRAIKIGPVPERFLMIMKTICMQKLNQHSGFVSCL